MFGGGEVGMWVWRGGGAEGWGVDGWGVVGPNRGLPAIPNRGLPSRVQQRNKPPVAIFYEKEIWDSRYNIPEQIEMR